MGPKLQIRHRLRCFWFVKIWKVGRKRICNTNWTKVCETYKCINGIMLLVTNKIPLKTVCLVAQQYCYRYSVFVHVVYKHVFTWKSYSLCRSFRCYLFSIVSCYFTVAFCVCLKLSWLYCLKYGQNQHDCVVFKMVRFHPCYGFKFQVIHLI